jgi:hypothetical protein
MSSQQLVQSRGGDMRNTNCNVRQSSSVCCPGGGAMSGGDWQRRGDVGRHNFHGRGAMGGASL